MRWRENHYRPTLELLEKRDVPATALWSGGYLYITSTTSHDNITVYQANGQMAVANTPISVGSAKFSLISASYVNKVVIYAYGGGDVINLRASAATAVTKPSYIYAGGGYNQVYGGGGSNYIVADSAGHNSLNGWYGNDDIAAGSATDAINGGGGFDWYYRPYNAADAFVDGEHVTDVKQGNSPSCQTEAALAEAVQQGFNFSKSIRYLGGSNYQVSLFGGAVHENVSFNGWYNSEEPIPTVSGEFWAVLMYRARLEYLGISTTADYTEAQWDSINASTGGQLYNVAAAISAFTGRSAQLIPINFTPQDLRTFLANSNYAVASTPNGNGVSANGIVYDHAYAVLSCYYQGGMWKVQLYNPWGFDSVNGITIESLAGGTPTNLGFITLSWAQFASSLNFQGVTIA